MLPKPKGKLHWVGSAKSGLPLPSKIMEPYQLSPAELEYLQQWYELEEIEQAERRVYTYEDWLDADRDIGPFALGHSGVSSFYLTPEGNSTQKGEGALTIFILPESEGQKIENHKAETVEGFTKAYTDALISYFESRFSKSFEKKILVENEMERVRKLLFEWKERFHYQTFGEGLSLSFFTSGSQKGGTMCEWYERICINGEDAKGAVSAGNSIMTASEVSQQSQHSKHLHFAVAALAFERFKRYLNQKLADAASQDKTAQVKLKPKIKSKYCCPETLEIMKGLVENFDVTQEEVGVFEEFFSMHPYTELNFGNFYRDNETRILDFDKLLDKIFEDADLFEGEVQDYFFECVIKDAQERNKGGWVTDFLKLKKRIMDRREKEKAATAAPEEPVKKKTEDKLPSLEEALKTPDDLPELWNRLSKMRNPLVSETGRFMWEGRPHAVLLALAQVLLQRDKVCDNLSPNEVYSILCIRFDVTPTNSLRQVRRGKRDLQEHLDAFIGALMGW